MKISDIRQMEESRNSSEDFRIIHLVKTDMNGNGKEFYRAYDWSAWLVKMFIDNGITEKPLKVSAKRHKDGYLETWVGFPVTSLDKYIPRELITYFGTESNDQIDVVLNLPAEWSECSKEAFQKAVGDWKDTLPVNEGKGPRRESQEAAEAAPRITRFSDIANLILSFPLEDKSYHDAWEFVRSLRKQVVAMF